MNEHEIKMQTREIKNQHLELISYLLGKKDFFDKAILEKALTQFVYTIKTLDKGL